MLMGGGIPLQAHQLGNILKATLAPGQVTREDDHHPVLTAIVCQDILSLYRSQEFGIV